MYVIVGHAMCPLTTGWFRVELLKRNVSNISPLSDPGMLHAKLLLLLCLFLLITIFLKDRKTHQLSTFIRVL